MAVGGAAQIFEMDAHHRFRFQVGSPINVSGESEGLEMASLVSTRDALPTHNTNASFAPNKHATVATEGDDFFKVRALAHTSHTSDLSPRSAIASFPLLITYHQATIALVTPSNNCFITTRNNSPLVCRRRGPSTIPAMEETVAATSIGSAVQCGQDYSVPSTGSGAQCVRWCVP